MNLSDLRDDLLARKCLTPAERDWLIAADTAEPAIAVLHTQREVHAWKKPTPALSRAFAEFLLDQHASVGA